MLNQMDKKIQNAGFCYVKLTKRDVLYQKCCAVRRIFKIMLKLSLRKRIDPDLVRVSLILIHCHLQ